MSRNIKTNYLLRLWILLSLFSFDVVLKNKTTSNINYGNSKLSFEYDIEEFVDWKREN